MRDSAIRNSAPRCLAYRASQPTTSYACLCSAKHSIRLPCCCNHDGKRSGSQTSRYVTLLCYADGRYVPRGGFLTDPHEVEQKVPLGGKPASSRAGGGRGIAKAAVEPKPAPRTAPPRKAAKAVLARTSHDQAAVSRAHMGVGRAKTALPAAVREPARPPNVASKPAAARSVQRAVPAAGLTSTELDASRGLMPQLVMTAQVPSKSLQDIDGFSAAHQQGQRAPEPLRGDDSAPVISGGHHELQPASPGAESHTAAGKARAATVPLSPPGVVLDRLGLAGEGWPGSSAGGSSVGEEGPQVLPLPSLSRVSRASVTVTVQLATCRSIGSSGP